MGQPSLPLLAGWGNYYEILGSAAGALTGLQFVVIVLLAQLRSTGSMLEIRAFGTPTVVHFGAALLVSAMMSAPWHSQPGFEWCLGAFGIGGLAYSLRVLFHAKKSEYNPDAEDWFWYAGLPIAAYTALLAAAVLAQIRPAVSPIVIAVTTVIFLVVGVHNSWDTVTYIATRNRENEPAKETVASE